MVVAGDVAMTPVASVSVDSAMSDATSGVYQMRIDPGSGTYGPWIAYAATQAITLSGSDGLKTVNVQYSDNAGLIATLTDTIVLDAGAPDTIPPTGAITINGAVAYTTSTAATLILSASDTGGSGLAEMRFSNDDSTWSAWEPYAPTTSWSLSAGDGAKTVYAQFRDGAGNASISYSDGITLDTTAPTGTIVIDGGAASTTTTSVSLALNADDSVGSGLAEMRFSNDDTTWSAWEAYAANKGWSLSAGEGAKTVYVQFRDVLGNTSGSFSDGITLVAPAATGTITFMWNAPDWGDPWADYYIYDYDGNLVHQASSSDIPGWYGWYTATVPVDSRPYSWHTEWYDPDFPEWDPGITDGTALIDYAGKAESYYY
jgi:uncharacterized membrane protein